MKLSTYETKQIETYLDAVRERLNEPEREETLTEIESHIHAAVEERQQAGEQGNLVAAVLAEMDAPEQFGDPIPSASPRRSKLAVASAYLQVAAAAVGLVYIRLEGDHAVILIPLLCVFGLLGIILAKTAIEKIKRSGGMLTGMGLALTCFLLPLIAIINLIASWAAMPHPLVSFGITGVAVVGSVVYMRYRFRSSRRRMAAGA